MAEESCWHREDIDFDNWGSVLESMLRARGVLNLGDGSTIPLIEALEKA